MERNLDIPVEEIPGLPARILTVCRYKNICTLRELAEQPAIFWLSCRNVGKKYIQTLSDVLKSYGLTMPGAARIGIITDLADSIETVIGIPGRVRTVCRHLGIKSLAEISMMTKSQWLNMRNVGLKSVYDLEELLRSKGMQFASEKQ